MRTFLGLIAWCLVVYGPEACRNPYTSFGVWCLERSGDWAYRDQRLAYDAGAATFRAGRNTRASCPHPEGSELAQFWLNGWDDEASIASLYGDYA